jgi:predicted porin
MNKKLMALAVASAVAAPAAFAQTSNVQIYGRASLGLDHYQAKGSPTAGGEMDGRLRVFDNSSRVGLRGTEALGGGLSAIFQIETGVNIDNGSNTGQGGQPNGSSGFWASRDSFVGLDSNFGRFTFGRQSIYWANGINNQTGANYIFGDLPWGDGTFGGSRMGRGTGGIGAVSRQSNTFAYTTPTFGGINGTLSYSPNAQETVQTIATSVDPDGRVFGVTLRGTWGPIYAQIDYVNNQGNTPLTAVTTQSEWEGLKGGLSWGYMPGARIGVIVARAEANNVENAALGDEINQLSWLINWEHTFGNFQALAQFGATGDLKDCDATTEAIRSCSNSKATGFLIGGRYLLSKRTWLFASYQKVNNKDNNFFDYVGGGRTSVNAAAGAGQLPLYGNDPQHIAIGIFHNF